MTLRANQGTDAAPTLWARVLRQMLVAAGRAGFDAAALRRALGVDAPELDDPDARLPLACMYDLCELCMAHADDEAAALRVGSLVEPEAFGALGLLAAASATVDEAMQGVWTYARLFIEGERYTCERTASGASYGYLPWGPARPAHAAAAQLFARDLAVTVPLLTGAPAEGVRVRLRHVPRRPELHAALLGDAVRFGAGVDDVTFPQALLARPLPRHDPMLQAILLRSLDEGLARLPTQSLPARAHEAVVRSLAGGTPTLDAVAARLAVSGRSLQRALAAAGTSYSTLLDDVRRARALALLDAGAAVAEVAWLVGYSEPSPFVRAVRRWTGASPAALRPAIATVGFR